MHNLLSYTPGDYVLNSLIMKQQLNILSSPFHIETSTPSTSIQDVLKLPEPIKRKTKRQYKKISYGIFMSDKVLEMKKGERRKEKDLQRMKNNTRAG